MTGELLQIRDLNVEFSVAKSWIPAVRGVDLDLAPGEVLALVGESGSGSRRWRWRSRVCWPATPG